MREIFSGIKTQLNDKGVILIDKVGANRSGGMPFFKKGIQYQRDAQEGLTELLENLLKELGFHLDKRIFDEQKDITKSEAIETIKNKSISCLSALSEEDIAEGIEEVEREFDDVITYRVPRELIIASKH